MNVRYIAVLSVLVLLSASGCERRPFWLLMMPPLGADNAPDTKSPINLWTPAAHPFASSDECKLFKANVIEFNANRSGKQTFQSMLKNFGPEQLAAAQTIAAAAICVSSDDPRLRPN